MTRWIGADEVGRLLVPGMTVFVAGATAEPLEILEALSLQGERCAGVRFVSVSLPGVNHTDFCEFHADTRSVAFFATRANRTSLENGQAEFMRLGYSASYEFLSSGPEIDLALVQLPPMQTGQPVSLGICADFLPAVLDRAGRVIGEINSRQPVPCNAPSMQPGRLTVDTGKIVTGVVLGSEALVRWAGTAQELAIRPVSYTHDTAVISAMDRFISINTALEVDLSGRVNAESIGGRQVSGPGGAVDMMRGAAGSRGGKSFIALNSTAKDGQVSRIVPALQPGTAVTAAGSDTDFIVTEFGARRVRGLRGEARARALIEIAHPDFRDQLADEWKEPTPV
jgi:acyl-CoA hydrolase